jgi:cell division protease FtsH
MGGRAAEELGFDHLSTGASNDLQQATDWARRMICEYGMSDKLGPVAYSNPDGGDVFLGRDFMARKEYSADKAREIDEEIARILHEKYAEAKAQLTERRETLDVIAEALLERETLGTSDLALLLNGDPLPPLPSPVEAGGGEDPSETPPASPEETDDEFPGGKLPDPEPMPS